jgi:hypothetical protein
MANFNRLYATIRLIRYALFQPAETALKQIDPVPGGVTRIAVDDFTTVLYDISRLLRPDNRLELLFEDALSPAAPFLLYRLKSAGFSGCRAIVSAEGIGISAMR